MNNAAVSGQVPITLIPNITLVRGTLTYFPAANLQAVVTLNATTTGSGQIGTFDATLLANGALKAWSAIERALCASLGLRQR